MEVKVHTQPSPNADAPAVPGPEAPIAPAVKQANIKNGILTITLRDGRTVGIRKMGPLDRMRMCSIIGPENSKNDLYLQVAVPAYCTATIDGEQIPRCLTVAMIEALAERLGDAALLEIMLAVTENFGNPAMNEIMSDFAKRQEIKNL